MKKAIKHQMEHLPTSGIPLVPAAPNLSITTKVHPSASIPQYWDKPLPPGLDPHLDKEEIIVFFKLSNTLLHEKLDPDSELYDELFPQPIYVSKRKPVWILSELMTWQESLKLSRSNKPVKKTANEGESP